MQDVNLVETEKFIYLKYKNYLILSFDKELKKLMFISDVLLNGELTINNKLKNFFGKELINKFGKYIFSDINCDNNTNYSNIMVSDSKKWITTYPIDTKFIKLEPTDIVDFKNQKINILNFNKIYTQFSCPSRLIGNYLKLEFIYINNKNIEKDINIELNLQILKGQTINNIILMSVVDTKCNSIEKFSIEHEFNFNISSSLIIISSKNNIDSENELLILPEIGVEYKINYF